MGLIQQWNNCDPISWKNKLKQGLWETKSGLTISIDNINDFLIILRPGTSCAYMEPNLHPKPSTPSWHCFKLVQLNLPIIFRAFSIILLGISTLFPLTRSFGIVSLPIWLSVLKWKSAVHGLNLRYNDFSFYCIFNFPS